MVDNPLVSIICTNYNYARFISDALDGFVKQKTNFPFEIIVVDDCSTDNSLEVINGYANKYPELFRVFVNKENKGINKNWIDICKEARGKYIARCDADDYWTDEYKLQKQVDALESHPNVKWCNTDLDFVDENKNVLVRATFKNGPVKNANTFEEMLATCGFTMSSSWLIETKLLQECNESIALDSADDCFSLQLELFNHTDLITIPDVTCACRFSNNSESRPDDKEKFIKRVEGLLNTQLLFLNKYPNHNTKKISEIALSRIAENEKRIASLSNEINDLKSSNKQLEEEKKSINDVLTLKNNELNALREEYNRVIGSRRWRYSSKVVNVFKKK